MDVFALQKKNKKKKTKKKKKKNKLKFLNLKGNKLAN
jgi:hypothetical protein